VAACARDRQPAVADRPRAATPDRASTERWLNVERRPLRRRCTAVAA